MPWVGKTYIKELFKSWTIGNDKIFDLDDYLPWRFNEVMTNRPYMRRKYWSEAEYEWLYELINIKAKIIFWYIISTKSITLAEDNGYKFITLALPEELRLKRILKRANEDKTREHNKYEP